MKDETDSIEEAIRQEIDSHPIVLFMKGSRERPLCGFSQRVVEVLERYNVPFRTHDVIANPSLREAIKRYSDWPTLPQLYIKGEFIGGCDIVCQLEEEGHLAKMLLDS